MNFTKYVLIRSNNTKPFNKSAVELIEALIQDGYLVKVDETSFQKIHITWDIEIEILEQSTKIDTTIPLVLSIYTAPALHYDLTTTADWKWFLKHVRQGQIPDKSCAVELSSRNQRLIAFLTSQKKILDMQKQKTVAHKKLTPPTERVE